MTIKRGDLYLAALDPVVGSEIAKTRPAVVVSNNLNNRYGATVTIIPVSSKKTSKIYPFELLLPKGCGNLPKISKAKADQVRTLDKARLIKYIGSLDSEMSNRLDKALRIHLNL
ncbi:MAG: type II toxin-antitoxin system PemK/MazF family toxin [Pseudomonadota bacterium]|nr:type II toxin-antitoxin system PemK/MazF family toxin [Pseudomonadota bacterium]